MPRIRIRSGIELYYELHGEGYPFVLIAGEDDRSAGAVSFRYRDGSQKNGVPVEDAVAEVVEAIRERRQV